MAIRIRLNALSPCELISLHAFSHIQLRVCVRLVRAAGAVESSHCSRDREDEP